MEDSELDPATPACLHLISAFLAMEPTDCLIHFARDCGKGSITEEVQSFIWEHCINKAMNENNPPSELYAKNFLKKIIVEVESSSHDVLDRIYEQFAYYMTSLKFLFIIGFAEVLSGSRSERVVIPLQCSVNMLEGDTGCSIWPSSLFLSEFILSYPDIFSNKSCFEVGSGVGLVGISLAYVKASKVILTDGDLSTLANMKLNLDLNQLNTGTEMSQGTIQDPNLVECKYLPWESASESELHEFSPDIVLGADVIYDPLCLPHLIRVLAILLNPKKSKSHPSKDRNGDSLSKNGCTDYKQHGADYNTRPLSRRETSNDSYSSKSGNRDDNGFGPCGGKAGCGDESSNSNVVSLCDAANERPVAYLATVIRNMDTFDCFVRLANQAHLSVVDITDIWKPLDLLPYMRSYDRSSIRLFCIKFS
ncbi:Nicotinamide N-methyltransferase-like [Macleaya cordata]|uniref:Nicotinamide N-methyltransferase-like n=1 Tax=Macleaya cordata TaxID=56857 RepID=A0A200Q1V2_MACCD|nr:Nicotinamide N-methyltransferase-like [Macleaya cordata]